MVSKFKFHEAFASKAKAKKREHKVNGFIRSITVRGEKRYVVMTRRRKK